MLRIFSGDVEKYWPDAFHETVEFGNAFIKKLSETPVRDVPRLTKRRLEILSEGSVSWHAIHQYHYSTWPDQNLQGGFRPLVDIAKIVKTNLSMGGNRTCLVHCSDSVNKTGVMIGLMNLMSDLDAYKDEIDVFATVYKMRAERMLMVISYTLKGNIRIL